MNDVTVAVPLEFSEDDEEFVLSHGEDAGTSQD
jgi:hypothetical protein